MIESKVVRARGKRAGDAGGRNDKRAKVLAGGGYVFITGTVVHIYLMGTYKGQNWSNCTLSIHVIYYTRGFPGGSVVKNPPANAEDTGDMSSIPGSGRSPGGENGNPLHYSCLEKSHGQRSLAGYSAWGCKETGLRSTYTHGQYMSDPVSLHPYPCQHLVFSPVLILAILIVVASICIPLLAKILNIFSCE